MLFIENYDAQSLDRSSVSMIDKFNGRLALVGELLDRLMALVDSLLATITDIREALGVCKTRIYNNLEQVKEVASGNGITGTESTIQVIEDALTAGDKAIAKAEATLEGIKEQESCDQDTDPTKETDNACGEISPQSEEANSIEPNNCTFCVHGGDEVTCSGNHSFDDSNICTVCNHDGCVVEGSCNEPISIGSYAPECDQYWGGVPNDPNAQCSLQTIYDPECDQNLSKDTECNQYTCTHNDGCAQQIPDNCSYSCTHSTPCSESPMPIGCTYTCTDNGCDYGGGDCTYGTVCGQNAEQEQETEECGQPCGETCHMTTEPEETDCSEGSCGEDCGNCGQQGCDETGTEQGCAEGSCGEGSCGML